MLNGQEPHEPEQVPRWVIPVAMVVLALIGGLVVQFRIEQDIADGGHPLRTVAAGPSRAENRGAAGTVPAAEGELEIDRADRGGDGSIGSLAGDGLWVDPRSSQLPWSALGAVDGLLTFRGNPTRTFHGQGPVPEDPSVLWTRAIGCSNSSVGGEAKQWCGTGWTGQPSVFRAPAPEGSAAGAGRWLVGVGGYNRSVNFFDFEDGSDALEPFATGDIIKGSITVDPDGFPLIYTGSRDNFFRVVAIDQGSPRELWRLSAASDEPTLWNDDWDSSAIVINDHLFVGGENSRFYVVKLNRGFDADGSVAADPEVVFSAAGWDPELLTAIGDRQVSIENSVAVSGATVYFTNSGGLVQGWDITGLEVGRDPERVFRYWTGDDTDASIVIDGDGMLYVASEYERGNARSRELGQVLKLDPSKPDDPLVWSREASAGINSGVWATPALYQDLLIVPTDDGRVLGIDRQSGTTSWTIELPGPLWSSPVVVDDVLIQGDCAGVLHAFDLSNGAEPPPRLWEVALSGCIESTPAVWNGQIMVGTRSGSFYAIG